MTATTQSGSYIRSVPARPATPEGDPLPWLTDQWRAAGCFDVAATDLTPERLRTAMGQPFHPIATTLAAIIGTVTSTVGALHSDADPYSVTFGGRDEGSTSFQQRRVTMGMRAVRDESLTDGQRAAVLSGIAVHEVGHIRHTRPNWTAVEREFRGSPYSALAAEVCNVADDARVEALMRAEFHGFAPTIDVMRWYLLGVQERDMQEHGIRFPVRVNLSTQHGRKVAWLAGARWPWIVDWTGHEELLARIMDWATRTVSAHRPHDHVMLIREAVDFIATDPEPEPEPEPEPQPEPEQEPEDAPEQDADEGEGEDTDSGSDEGDEGDDEATEPGESGDEGDDADDDESDADDEGDESNGPTESDEPSDEDGDEDDAATGTSKDESEPEGESEGEGDEPEDDAPEGDEPADEDDADGAESGESDADADEDGESEQDGTSDPGEGEGSTLDFGGEDDEDDEDDEDEPDGWDDPENWDDDEDEPEGDEQGDDADAGEDADDADADGEGEGAGWESAEGDEESDDDSDADNDPTDDDEATGGIGGGDDSDDAEAEDIPTTDDIDVADCAADANRDVTDDLAQATASAHQRASRKVARIRRYPHSVTAGEVVAIRERKVVRTGKPGPRLAMAPIGDDEATEQAAMSEDFTGGEQLRYQRRVYGIPDHPTCEDTPAAQALVNVITSARKGEGAPERYQRSGRIDRSRLAAVANGDARVFTRRTAVAPQNVRAHILVDCSGSMWSGARITRAAQTARNVAHALDLIPWATGKVYGHTTDEHGEFVVPVWESGEGRDRMDDLVSIQPGDNWDGYAIAYVADDLLEVKRPNERGVVIVISDGYPTNGNGFGHVRSVADYYRRRGLRVVAISMAPGVQGQAFGLMYGGDVVEYEANPQVFARSLARVIGSSI